MLKLGVDDEDLEIDVKEVERSQCTDERDDGQAEKDLLLTKSFAFNRVVVFEFFVLFALKERKRSKVEV